MSVPLRILPAVLLVTGLTAAACGSVSDKIAASDNPAISGAPTTATAPDATTATQAVTVTLRTGSLGKYLADSQGRSLYLFEADHPRSSACAGACARAWPPLTTMSTPVSGAGVQQGLLALFKRGDGSEQVTYNGHPLYYYGGDGSAGQTQGQGLSQFGAKWYLLSASGVKIDTD
jgi:predicted lipoprotein with Yx(FWY)xxD motif